MSPAPPPWRAIAPSSSPGAGPGSSGAVKALGAGGLIGLLFPLWVAAATAAVIAAMGDLGRYYQNGPTASWRKGARGERKTARALAPLAAAGYIVLHGRAIPGSSANIDHVAVGPAGV